MSLLLRSTLILALTLLALAGVGVLKARAAAGIGHVGKSAAVDRRATEAAYDEGLPRPRPISRQFLTL